MTCPVCLSPRPTHPLPHGTRVVDIHVNLNTLNRCHGSGRPPQDTRP